MVCAARADQLYDLLAPVADMPPRLRYARDKQEWNRAHTVLLHISAAPESSDVRVRIVIVVFAAEQRRPKGKIPRWDRLARADTASALSS